ncbi:galactose oxidase [Gigaspora margarita]|uniref:Galactose oxidase n=1 Tax=Gigaspora margarita TaxID=4874 RepID=A0A8H4EU71_GIGMA|nr:galactose oxidase [Gigaspora margarita]
MNPFRALFFSLIFISLALTNVRCFGPDGRVGQASVLIGSNLYFFGGNTMNPRFTDQVIYLNLSSSFNILSPPWNPIATSPIPILLNSAVPCLSTDKSTVYLVGGMSQNQQNSSILMIPQSSVYAFNTNNLSWTTPNIDGFNSTFLGRADMNGVADSNGNCYSFGGFFEHLTAASSSITYNDTNIFDTKAMRWLTRTLPNTPLSRVLYSAVLKDNLIFYIGGLGDTGNTTFDMNKIPIFDIVNLKWLSMTTRGDPIGSRFGHSAVLTQDGLILIYGGSGISGSSNVQVQPDVATLDVSTTPYIWKAIITDKAPRPLMYHSATLFGIYMIIAFGSVVPQPASSKLALNNNLYIFNAQNYSWVNTFDVLNIHGSNSTNSDSSSLGVKIGTSIGVVIFVGIIAVVGFFFYKKFRNHKSVPIATPGTLSYK